MKPSVQLMIVLMVLSVATLAHADKIVLKNGREIQGRIVERQERRVLIESRGMVLTLDASTIATVEETSLWENNIEQLKLSQRRRTPLKSLEIIGKLPAEGIPDAEYHGLLLQILPEIRSMLAQFPSQEKHEVRRVLQAMIVPKVLPDDVLFLYIQIVDDLGDWETVGEYLEEIDDEALQSNPIMRAWTQRYYRQSITKLLARDDFELTVPVMERLRRLSNDDQTEDLAVAVLSRAAVAREKADFASAIRILVRELYPISPAIATNRLIYIIEQVILNAEATGRFDENLQALRILQPLMPLEYMMARRRIIHMDASAAMKAGDLDRVIRLVEEIPPQDRVPELKQLYSRAQHELRIVQIDQVQGLDLLKHGQWCMENGLYDEAAKIFAQTRENPNLRELSDQLTQNLRRDNDTRMLEQADTLFKDGRLDESHALVLTLMNRDGIASSLMDETQKLLKLVEKSRARDEERRPYEAEVFFQRAQRAFFLGELTESYNLLNLVLSRFTDTPAAKRAADLLPSVLQAMELALIEGREIQIPEFPKNLSPETLRRNDELGKEVTKLVETLKNS